MGGDTQKTAIITGVSSFVGCHLARGFADAGWSVMAVTSRPLDVYDAMRARRLNFIKSQVEFAVCDLTDAHAVGALVKAHRPDVWVQHAGYADNYASIDYNLEKSLALNVVALEPLYRHLQGVDCGVIVTGSSLEYGFGARASREDDVCWPELPYGVSKLAGTLEASRLARQYGVPTRVARLYIPVGFLDVPGKLMDFVIKQLAAGQAVDLSPCQQRRDFLSVEDVVQAYVLLAGDMGRTTFDVFNVCSGEATPLKGLLLELVRMMDADAGLLNFGAKSMRPGEPMVSFGDNAKARDILGWHPRNIREALETVVKNVLRASGVR